MNISIAQKLWKKVVNKSCEQKFCIKPVNESFERKLWGKNLNKICEQKFEQKFWKKLGTKIWTRVMIIISKTCFRQEFALQTKSCE